METRKLKLALSAGALALSMALAGCGGGGGSASGPPNEPGGMTLEEKQAAQRRAINTAISTARTATGTALEKRDMASANAATQAISTAKAEIGKATDLPAAEKAAFNTAIATLESGVSGVRTELAKAADKMNKATAAKLFAGLSADPAFDLTTLEPTFEAMYGKATKVTVGTTAGNAELAKATGMTLDSQGMWSGTMVKAAVKDGNTDTVTVYTNIEAPKEVDFGMVHPLQAGRLAITAAHAGMISGPFSDGNAPMPHGSDDGVTAETLSFAGMFDGASGTYRCTESSNTSCTSQGDGDGGILLSGGPWTFEPSKDAKAKQKDENYARFGWWLRQDSADMYSVATFHNYEGEDTWVEASFSLLTGDATYSGPAVGKYAMKHNTGAPSEYHSGGHFDATVTLTADFGDRTAAGMISGSVDGFMVDGQSMPWKVTFAESDLTAQGAFGADADDATWAIGETASTAKGNYVGNLREQKMGLPGTATGTWTVPFNTAGHMIGAFGATKQ